MKKTLYSLMLNEDVVREIDLQAHRLGTNRSSLVNQILAEYVSVMTPEKRINDIFGAVAQLLQPDRELVPYYVPNQPTMSLKSILEYKYRPTVKYEVQMYSKEGHALGELSVIYRTQSAALIEDMTRFFRLLRQIETACLEPLLGVPIQYALYDGRFVRSIQLNRSRDYSTDDIAEAISRYIKVFDTLLKGYLGGRYTAQQVEEQYVTELRKGNILL